MTFQETISAYIQERYQITPDFPFKNIQTISSFVILEMRNGLLLIMPLDAQLLGATENKHSLF